MQSLESTRTAPDHSSERGYSDPYVGYRLRLPQDHEVFFNGSSTQVEGSSGFDHVQSQSAKSRNQTQLRSEEELTCDQCLHVAKTPSDLKKHYARHQSPYKCDEDCPRSVKGFATVNDLNRHQKSVHGRNSRNSKYYKCFAPGCAKSAKQWPRLDNFKQHLVRMHDEEDIEELVRKSMEWYESQHGSAGPAQSPAIAEVLGVQEQAARGPRRPAKRRRGDSSPSTSMWNSTRSRSEYPPVPIFPLDPLILSWDLSQSQTAVYQAGMTNAQKMSASQRVKDGFELDDAKALGGQGAVGSQLHGHQHRQHDYIRQSSWLAPDKDHKGTPTILVVEPGRPFDPGDSPWMARSDTSAVLPMPPSSVSLPGPSEQLTLNPFSHRPNAANIAKHGVRHFEEHDILVEGLRSEHSASLAPTTSSAAEADRGQDLIQLGSGVSANPCHSQPLEPLSPDALLSTSTIEAGSGKPYGSVHGRTQSTILGESACHMQDTDVFTSEIPTRQHPTSSISRMQQILSDLFPSAGIVQNENDNQQSGPEDGSDGPSSHQNSNKVSHSQVRNGTSNPRSRGAHEGKVGEGFHSEEDDGGNDDAHPSKRKTADETEELARPSAKIACPFHQHDPIRYAACQSYRTEKVDSMYRHHLCEYHVQQRHIDDAKLKRLKALGQRKRHRTPSERWWSIYLELFMDNDSPDYASPSPFWAPTLSSTNLADLVSATVELVRAEVGSLSTLCLKAISERVDFQVDRVFTEELQMVDRRWSMVREETLAYLHDSGYGSLDISQAPDGGAGKVLPDTGSDIYMES